MAPSYVKTAKKKKKRKSLYPLNLHCLTYLLRNWKLHLIVKLLVMATKCQNQCVEQAMLESLLENGAGLFPKPRLISRGLQGKRTKVLLQDSTCPVLTGSCSEDALWLPPCLSKILKWQKLSAQFEKNKSSPAETACQLFRGHSSCQSFINYSGEVIL